MKENTKLFAVVRLDEKKFISGVFKGEVVVEDTPASISSIKFEIISWSPFKQIKKSLKNSEDFIPLDQFINNYELPLSKAKVFIDDKELEMRLKKLSKGRQIWIHKKSSFIAEDPNEKK